MDVPGLRYIAGFVAAPEETALVAAVDGEPWLANLKRWVQPYGYRYDCKARKADPSMYFGPLPAWARPLANGHLPAAPDQLVVNNYEPGLGITAHVGCVPCFGPVVCSLTLRSQCVMELSALEGGRQRRRGLPEIPRCPDGAGGGAMTQPIPYRPFNPASPMAGQRLNKLLSGQSQPTIPTRPRACWWRQNTQTPRANRKL